MQAPPFDTDALVKRLAALADGGYRDFSAALIPGSDAAMLGVRVPQLRSVAKELLKGDWRAFLEASRDSQIYEMKLLHGYVLGGAKCAIDEKLALTEAFLPHIDNWAVCDGFCSSYRVKNDEKDALFAFVKACAESDIEFRKRFGLIMLMSCFHDAPYLDGTMAVYRGFAHPGYYARMGAAWGLATLYLHAPEAVLAILKEDLWDDFTHNKAIQKLRESYRVSDDDKAMLMTLRRKVEKRHE